MKTIQIIFRSFFKKGQNNIIKIISLGTGLAVGLVLLSKVSFDSNFDNFFPDSDRIYRIMSFYNLDPNSKEEFTYDRTPGAVAPGMKTEIVNIEQATRYTSWMSEGVFSTADKHKYKGSFILADSCFFDLFPRKILIGSSAKDILSNPMTAIISKSIADRMGDNIIGKEIDLERYPGRKIVISGIFEDYPPNSHLHYSAQIIVSLNSIGHFMGDGRDNWLGNDRYFSYVKFYEGTDPLSLASVVRQVQEKYQDIESLEKHGTYIRYSFMPLTKIYSDSDEVKRMILILSIIAFALIITSVLNYLLSVINSLASRSKEIGVHKCYGASSRDITNKIFLETFVYFSLSLLLATLLVVVFKNVIESILVTPIAALINTNSIIFLSIICLIIFFFAAFIPAKIFTKIPIISVFRSLGKSRKEWKLALLLIQIVGASFLFCLLIIVSKQYDMVVNDDPGYSYKNILYTQLSGVDQSTKQTVIDRLNNLPEVEVAASGSTIPMGGFSGNNVRIIGQEEDLFNIADFYNVSANYTDIFDIKIIEGKGFDENSVKQDIIVNQDFADRLRTITQWDNIIDREIYISEHEICKIVGVNRDIRVGSLVSEDKRPTAMFYSNEPSEYIIIRLKEMSSENISKVNGTINEIVPERETYVSLYSDEMIKAYDGVKRFNKSILIGGAIAIVITLMGLIGYLNSEVVRRTAEIAIRKINGATLVDILSLFAKDILKIGLVGIVIGSCISLYVAEKWLESFSLKTSLSPLLFISCGTVLLVFIELIVLANCYKVANQNPIDSLKTE